MADLTASAGERERDLDYLQYQLAEFGELDPKAGEVEELQERLAQHRADISVRETVELARRLLQDNDHSVIENLFTLADRLSKLPDDVQILDEAAQRAERMVVEAQELHQMILSIRDHDTGAETAEVIEQRLDRLAKLTRKHGGDLAHALEVRKQLQQKLDDLVNIDQALLRLKQDVQTAKADYLKLAEELSRRRKKVAPQLSGKVSDLLHQLEMPHARFECTGIGDGEPSAKGVDAVAFLLAANPGDVPMPLRKVASGGELSRVMLAIHQQVGVESAQATLVFDEADAGIGGQTALTIGEQMRTLGSNAQVLVVTHTAQVAAYAHHHIHLEKGLEDGRACTFARGLNDDQRRAELARMLGVRDTATAEEYAASLLKQVQIGKEATS